MKKSLRFASAALAVALAASCAAPAFAAGGSSFTKSETVYAVMNADGSIQSTTVSEHVYSASGLSKVTDQSTLTNIQNTESSAEFTQDGEKLVWNTDDTDVYYKGDTDRALPIQATVTYALDGQEAALEDLIGKSGHLTMTIALKNNETGTVNVNGTDRTIVTPLVTAVGVIFGQDATNVVAAHGLVESAAKSNVAAFVTLPGGIGTFEEFFEALTLKQLGRHAKAMAVLNTLGYYDAMEAMLVRAVEERFFPEDGHALYAVFTDAAALLDYVESYEAEPEDVWKEKILGKYNAEK